MSLTIIIGLLPAVLAWVTARWIPSHKRLLEQASSDLALAEQFGRGPVAQKLRRRAKVAAEEGMKLRDSNDLGRRLAVFAAIGLAGTLGLPAYWSAFPQAVEDWRGPVMLTLWAFYLLFTIASAIGWTWWMIKRPR